MKTMAAAKFKATCLAVMDEVQAKREPVLLTKNGKPVAKLVPIEEEFDPIFGFYKGRSRSSAISSRPSIPTRNLRSSSSSP